MHVSHIAVRDTSSGHPVCNYKCHASYQLFHTKDDACYVGTYWSVLVSSARLMGAFLVINTLNTSDQSFSLLAALSIAEAQVSDEGAVVKVGMQSLG